jgi:hypothetical protein
MVFLLNLLNFKLEWLNRENLVMELIILKSLAVDLLIYLLCRLDMTPMLALIWLLFASTNFFLLVSVVPSILILNWGTTWRLSWWEGSLVIASASILTFSCMAYIFKVLVGICFTVDLSVALRRFFINQKVCLLNKNIVNMWKFS